MDRSITPKMARDMSVFNIFIVLFILAMGVWGGLSLIKRRQRSTLAENRLRGRRGEQNAEIWLANYGFKQIESQTQQTFSYYVNGVPQSFKLRPDLMARYEGQQWLIEVKTGQAASPGHAATRRQIREYAELWPHRRYGLFDASQGVLHEISFKRSKKLNFAWLLSQLRSPFAIFMLVVGLLIGGVIGVYLEKIFSTH